MEKQNKQVEPTFFIDSQLIGYCREVKVQSFSSGINILADSLWNTLDNTCKYEIRHKNNSIIVIAITPTGRRSLFVISNNYSFVVGEIKY